MDKTSSGIDQLLQAASIMNHNQDFEKSTVNSELLKINSKLPPPENYKLTLNNDHIEIRNKIAILHHLVSTIEDLKNTKNSLYRQIDSRKKLETPPLICETDSDDESREFKQKFRDELKANPAKPFTIIFLDKENINNKENINGQSLNGQNTNGQNDQ